MPQALPASFFCHFKLIFDVFYKKQPKPSKTIEKTRVLKNFVFFQRRRKKRPKELPQEAPGKPKRLPGAPRERPGAAQEAQRQRQERPRATQERPKSRPREQKRIQLSIPLLGGAREASGSHFEAIWERFWSLRGGMLEPFSIDVRTYSGRILAAVFFRTSSCFPLLFAPFGFVLGLESPKSGRARV